MTEPIQRPLFAVLLCLLIYTLSLHAQDTQDLAPSYSRYAMANEGDAVNGERLFAKHEKLACTNCHNITGMEKSGPNLEGIGDKYDRAQLIREVLFPNQTIKPGFEQVVIVTRGGATHVGRVERINKTVHRIIDSQGKQHNIPSKEVDGVKQSSISLMPDNLVSTISREEFADLMAYLRNLSFSVHQGLVAGGKSIELDQLRPSVTFHSIHPPEVRFENPVWCGELPGTDSDLLVIEHHNSQVWRLIRNGEQAEKALFLDLSGETYLSNNQGLMCMAFHPEYQTNRRYFLKHEVKEEGQVKTTVVERRATADGLQDSGEPSRRLLEVAQPAFNHNGGCLDFGPDGLLYIAFGDGGPQEDPPGYSQNPRIFHGSMLRIDVDHQADGLPYAIPADNPFLQSHRQDAEIRPETWAIGFREPWRFSFDPANGELYVGDVGQNKFEEVCLVRRGENHGWNVREAYAPFSDQYQRAGERYTEPLFAYEHGLGFSVTGGYVYRGQQNASFDGVYIFGDYNTRRVWGLKQHGGVVQGVAQLGIAPGGIASFGRDQQGEIYLVTYMGTVYHVDLTGAAFPK